MPTALHLDDVALHFCSEQPREVVKVLAICPQKKTIAEQFARTNLPIKKRGQLVTSISSANFYINSSARADRGAEERK